MDAGNAAPARPPPAVPPGRLRRRDRHARGHRRARRSTSSRSCRQQRAAAAITRGPLRQAASCRCTTKTARWRSTTRSSRGRRPPLEGLAKLTPVVRRHGRRAARRRRQDASLAGARRSYPDLEINHVHHAGNCSGVVDGAAAILLASPDYAKAHGLEAARPHRRHGQRRRRPDADAQRAGAGRQARCWRRPA